MTNSEQIEKLAELANSCHQIERNIEQPFVRMLDINGYSQRALAHIQHARMYAGDLLRLAVLKSGHRKEQFFDVVAHGGRYTGELTDFDEKTELIKWAKRELQALFYIICDEIHKIGGFLNFPGDTVFSEWDTCFIGLRLNLKSADQCLGLWLGHIYDTYDAHKHDGEFLTGVAGNAVILPPPAEATFDAIMKDVMPFLKNCSIQPQFRVIEVEAVLRRHLGLPPKPKTQNPKP